jgi:hypothetical protein
MNRLTCLALGLSMVSAGAWAETAVVPGDSPGGPILHGAAAYRRHPCGCHAKSTHEDPRDIRVFNAAGDVVPYDPAGAIARRAAWKTSLPLPALWADSPKPDGLRVTIQRWNGSEPASGCHDRPGRDNP